MPSDVILKFYSGSASQLATLTNNKATCIGLQTDTGKLFWKMYGNKIYLKVGWEDISEKPQDLSDSAALIETVQSTLEQMLPLYDFTEIKRQDLNIDNTAVVVTGTGTQRKFTYNTGKSARPCWVYTSGGNLHDIQPQAITIGPNGKISIELSRYLAYQNLTEVPNGWKLCYR